MDLGSCRCLHYGSKHYIKFIPQILSSIQSSIHAIWPPIGTERIIRYDTCIIQRCIIRQSSIPSTSNNTILPPDRITLHRVIILVVVVAVVWHTSFPFHSFISPCTCSITYCILFHSTYCLSIMRRTGISRQIKVSVGHQYGPIASSSTVLGPDRREEHLADARASWAAEVAGMCCPMFVILASVSLLVQKCHLDDDRIFLICRNPVMAAIAKWISMMPFCNHQWARKALIIAMQVRTERWWWKCRMQYARKCSGELSSFNVLSPW